MRRLATGSSLLAACFLLFAVATVNGQSFEDQQLGDWYPNTEEGNYDTAAQITDARASDGTYSVEVSVGSDLTSGAFANDNQPVSAEDTLRFQVWVDQSNLDQIDGIQPFAQDDSWSYNTPGYADLTAGEWNEVKVGIPEDWSGTNRIGLQIDATSESATPTVFVDEVTLNGTILPVELTAFDAVLDGNDAVVHWTTASETNNAGFDVMHKAPEMSSYRQVAFVDGKGTTTQPQNYEHRVSDLSAGTHQFQLRQVDVDGTTSPSTAITVEVGMEATARLKLAGANPFRSATRVQYSVQVGGSVHLSLYDALGRKVRTVEEQHVSDQTTQTVTVNGSDLSSGVYFLRLQTQDVTKTQRLTVVK